MQEYALSGSHYEMGRQNALLLQETGYSPRPATEEQQRFAAKCEEIVSAHAPWLVEEIHGVAETGVFDPATVKVLPLSLYNDFGCSAVAVSGSCSRDGRTVFGRNYDYFYSFRKYNCLYRTRSTEHLSHIACSDQWVGRHDGVNEAGLAIGHSGPVPRDRQPGFVITLAVRAVLDTCRTVTEAEAFLKRIPHLGNSTYLVADAAGDIAAVDASPHRVLCTRQSGFGFAANQYVSPEMLIDAGEGRVGGSERRMRNFKRWFTTNRPAGSDEIQHVLADPEDGVCNDGRDASSPDDPDVTLWSWVTTLGDRELRLAKGTPNVTPYEPVTW